jgi:Zn-dependent peptidase ImmA (M78 family)
MQPTNQYAEARQLALEIRRKYGLTSSRIMVNDLKNIYRKEGIDKVDYWDKFKGTRLKGAYFNDEYGKTVVINKKIIKQIEPKVFTMAHELKHHLLDKVVGVSFCSDDNEKKVVERAADAFASELIYPANLFIQDMAERNIELGKCTATDIVKLKHETQTTMSHTALALKASRLGYCTTAILEKVQWHKLRDQHYPEYVRFRKARAVF